MSAQNTAVKTRQLAVNNRPPSKILLFHSDRVIQYAFPAIKSLLERCSCEARSIISMGNFKDNAVAESIFKTLKVEFIYKNRLSTYYKDPIAIFEWIETWYNKNRRHTALWNLIIREFEKRTKLKCMAKLSVRYFIASSRP